MGYCAAQVGLKIIPFYGLLRSASWFKTHVSGVPILPFFKDQAVQNKGGQLDSEYGTDR